jgi:tRNA threonylcarbamoyladenosine biosynthesis protein TsaE
MSSIIKSNSPEETVIIGKKFAESLKPNDIIGLKGELGSGKTQFVKGIGKYFNVNEFINSPTFIIVNIYKGTDPLTTENLTLNHFDLYRLNKPDELSVIGFDDYTYNGSIVLIEWCDLAEEYLGKDLKKVFFKYGELENERIIEY